MLHSQCAECSTMSAVKHRDCNVTFCVCVIDTNNCNKGLEYVNAPLVL